MRIAIIGSGISGNGAAYALTKYSNHEVVVYEQGNRVGGHACTVDATFGNETVPVDIGFIVFNNLNYPNLLKLFDELGVESQETDMGFGASLNDGKTEWSGRSLNTVFTQRSKLASPRFIRMLLDILRFNKQAAADLEADRVGDVSLGGYLVRNRFTPGFVEDYLAPMGAAIWSTPDEDILNFPAESFLRFFNNHRLISFDRPRWRTVTGGSREYVKKLTAPFADKIRTNSKVVSVRRHMGQVFIRDINGHEDTFDHVVFAGHTDQTLTALDDVTPLEEHLLSSIQYRKNRGYLHSDSALMPKREKVWSAWNYLQTSANHQQSAGVCVSYWMNALQNIDQKHPLFVTLNPVKEPSEDKVHHRFEFSHPQFDMTAISAQQALPTIQGRNNTWFCGAWTKYGFHEDGLRSGLEVAEQLGAEIPWRSENVAANDSTVAIEAAE